ncbi:MAG: hypothetical protein ACRC1M_03310 [Methanobacteriaceae archaeon]
MVTEEEIVNRTENRDLKDLYWELRSMILSWDNNIYVDILKTPNNYFVFKRKNKDRNLVAFGFSKNHIHTVFNIPDLNDPKKITSEIVYNDRCRQVLFIKKNITDKNNGIILQLEENNTGKDRYSFITQDNEPIDIYYIIHLLMQQYLYRTNEQYKSTYK